jgi:ABC-2 type transport system ATP-binding protein
MMRDRDSLLTLRQVRKIYPNGKIAVKGMDLCVAAGEIFGLLGPNGAGKTTTIRMIIGALRPTSGAVFFNGQNVWTVSGRAARALKRRIGYLAERPVMFEKLTPVEFLTFIGELYGLDDSGIQLTIEKYLGYFGLLERRNEYLEKFSAGMRKRVAAIAAIIGSPDILLLDEPFSDLDPESIFRMKSLIRDLKREGKAVVVSTHFLGLASELTDRMAIIHRGELLFCGREVELRNEVKQPEGVSLETLFLHLTGSEMV